MEEQGFSTGRQVEQHFVQRVLELTALAGRSSIIWQVCFRSCVLSNRFCNNSGKE